jgi:hypothetical protein
MKTAEQLLIELALAHEELKAARKRSDAAYDANKRLGVCRRACMREGKRLVKEIIDREKSTITRTLSKAEMDAFMDQWFPWRREGKP